MTETTTYNLPLADEGDGGVVAEIRVRDGALDWHALTAVAEVLGRSAAPITLSFAVDRPPPLFVTVPDAARSLGTSEDYVAKLVREKVLPVVEWNNSTNAVARTYAVIPWEALVAVAEEAKRTGELPLITRRLRGNGKKRGVNYTEILFDVMREARSAGEGPLKMADMQARVSARYGELHPERAGTEVPYRTIQSAMLTGVKRSLIERHEMGYRPGKSGHEYRYSWRPEIEALYRGRETVKANTRKAKANA